MESVAEDWGKADSILFSANGLLNALGDSTVTPFADVEHLRLFLASLQTRDSASRRRDVLHQADQIVDVLKRNVLANADVAFGELKGQVLVRHPRLPDPGWTIGIKLR